MKKKPRAAKKAASSNDAKAVEGSYAELQHTSCRFVLRDGTYRLGNDLGTYTASKLDAFTYEISCVSTHPDFKGMRTRWHVTRKRSSFVFRQMPNEIDLCGWERHFKREGGPDAVPIASFMERQRREAPRSTAVRPVSDFISFILDWGHPEWVVLAVESPIENVTPLYASLCGAKRSWLSVPVRPPKRKHSMALLIPLVQAKECKWTVIYRLMCYPIGSQDIEQGTKSVQELSAKLKTRALAFFGEDTSGAMEFTLYRNGEKTGTTSWESQNDPADEAFGKLGLSVPACYPGQAGKTQWVSAGVLWAEKIRRADIVDIMTVRLNFGQHWFSFDRTALKHLS